MTTTITILQSQFSDVQKQLSALEILFGRFRGYANGQFVSIHERLDTIETKMDSMATKADVRQLEGRLDDRFTDFEGRFNDRFIGLEGRFTGLEERLNDQFAGLEQQLTKFMNETLAAPNK